MVQFWSGLMAVNSGSSDSTRLPRSPPVVATPPTPLQLSKRQVTIQLVFSRERSTLTGTWMSLWSLCGYVSFLYNKVGLQACGVSGEALKHNEEILLLPYIYGTLFTPLSLVSETFLCSLWKKLFSSPQYPYQTVFQLFACLWECAHSTV